MGIYGHCRTLYLITNKKNIMKRIILLTALFMGFNLISSAQFYNQTLLFIEVGQTIESSSSIVYVHFNDDGKMYKTTMSKSTARTKYKDGVLEEYGVNVKHSIKRDYTINSSKYSVYSEPRIISNGWGITHYWYGIPQYGETSSRSGSHYYGVSRTEMVTWYTTSESNEAKNKKYYKAISASDLIPKEVQYDFL